MDPTTNLSEQLNLARKLLDDEAPFDRTDGPCLAELVLALHEWISKGGFLPEQWRRKD